MVVLAIHIMIEVFKCVEKREIEVSISRENTLSIWIKWTPWACFAMRNAVYYCKIYHFGEEFTSSYDFKIETDSNIFEQA